MKKFCIIDSFALMFRAYYALPDMKTQDGLPSGAVFGMANFLIQILETWRPDYLVAVIDMSKPTFRHKEYSEYKANRSAAPDEFKVQIEHVFKLMKTFNIPVIGKEGYEADDLAGTYAVHVVEENEDVEVICFTGDQDYFQLINDRVSMMAPQVGFHKAKLYTPEGVMDKLGVKPNQIIDFKALTGDASDNVPGVYGVGKKTAAKLLDQYQTLQGVYDHIDEIKGKLQERLIEHKDNAFLSQRLVTIDTNVPIEKNILKESQVEDIPFADIEAMLLHYDCFSSVRRLKRLQNGGKPAPKKVKIQAQVDSTQQSLF